MANRLKLTVVLPAHNAETTLAAAIQSILYQSYSDFELWVLENGSSDRTLEVARSFSDPRVKVFEMEEVGFQNALSYALENAQTEWLARMDADDLSFPDRFKEQIEVIEQHPEFVFIGTQRSYLTPAGHIIEPAEKVVSKEVTRLSMRSIGDDRKFFIDCSVIFKRSVALDVGGYDPEFQMGDVPLWFRMLTRGKGWEIPRPLYLYRLKPASLNLSQSKPSDQFFRVLKKYTPELLHLYYPEGKYKQKPASYYQQNYWLEIALHEALTGDRKATLRAVNALDKDGPYKNMARLLRLLSYSGPLGAAYYRWHRRNKFRHRPDWEKLFTSLVGPLRLDKSVYP